MIRVAVVGYGNIGHYALESLKQKPDMVLAGVVSKSKNPGDLGDVIIVKALSQLEKVDVALLCVPTREVPTYAKEALCQGIHTVDSYDVHGELADLRLELDLVAKEHRSVAVLSAGWDPGIDSMIRGIMEFSAPTGITYTNFGPGMSMGHSVAVKAIEGVADALSLTIPKGTGLHRRMVYVVAKEGANQKRIEETLRSDPYFVNDETYVEFVPDIKPLQDVGHGVFMERKGGSSNSHNQRFTWSMGINNPALTAEVMVACARFAKKASPGAYTMLEIPILDLLPGDKDALIRRLV